MRKMSWIIRNLHKKERRDMKGNYRSISTLPTFSKIFEKHMFAQISTFSITSFSNQQCVFENDKVLKLSSSNVGNVEEVFR